MRVCGLRHAPANLSPEMTWYPLYLYKRLGGPQGRSGQVREISSFPGLVARIVQYVASRHTDWAIPAHLNNV
jgi:hypothetical protein